LKTRIVRFSHQTILLNTLVSEFVIIDNNLGPNEMVQGLCMLDANLVVYGQYTWLDLKVTIYKILREMIFSPCHMYVCT
jgi:hypothetical protein